MATTLDRPGTADLDEALSALRGWQQDGTALQLHPGDVGWRVRIGADAATADLRTWRREGTVVALGMLDGRVLRLALDPAVWRDEPLARRIVADLAEPGSGVLPAGEASLESPNGSAIHDLALANGWDAGESWTPLRRDLSAEVEEPGVRVEAVGPERVSVRTAVHRASFPGSTFGDNAWRTMAAGSAYADARCLVAFDDDGAAVAAATVWSAGPGRPGLLEPVGTHQDHRGHGYGRAISVAAARTLQELGSSSAIVCTPTANEAAVATYRAAGFVPEELRLDATRRAH
ncbi:GNAT family N-acetyltransferase [Luteimicrobium sp. DT211]|uniref:GNAT family N-acetyltransferase n=1 Tax=Luteimicrobium sp. DT211 TaxID=3393412 RepID=UPI003CEBF939